MDNRILTFGENTVSSTSMALSDPQGVLCLRHVGNLLRSGATTYPGRTEPFTGLTKQVNTIRALYKQINISLTLIIFSKKETYFLTGLISSCLKYLRIPHKLIRAVVI